MTENKIAQIKRHPSSFTLDRFIEKKGYYARLASGKKVPKSVGIMLEREGRRVVWVQKPGWQDGCLVDAREYEDWFDKVKY